MKLRNLCNVFFESLPNRCSGNRTGRSRVISCHSRDIGVDCLPFCNHYKDNGWGYVRYHDLREYPIWVDLSLIRSQCVVVVVKCLKVLATYRKYGTQ
jgi:hypothetical protein